MARHLPVRASRSTAPARGGAASRRLTAGERIDARQPGRQGPEPRGFVRIDGMAAHAGIAVALRERGDVAVLAIEAAHALELRRRCGPHLRGRTLLRRL